MPWSLLMEEDGAILLAKMKSSLQDFVQIYELNQLLLWPFIMQELILKRGRVIEYSFNLCLSIDRRRCFQNYILIFTSCVILL